jgi:pyruvate/2-oxoglutarate/acetoin dehydrogenase E1 component
LNIGKDKLADMYEKMMVTRRFEETAAKLFTQGKVHGTAHFCIGEEATGIGVCAALQPQDQIYATHRGHGQSIGKGMDVKRMMAEFLGKATGVCRGKGGCMHIAELAVGNLGANGIVAGGIPIAVGAAITGMRPIVEIMFSDFLTIAMDQLANQAAKARYQFGGKASVPMVLRTPGGSGTGAAAQHSQSVEAWVCNVPGLKVVIPSTPYDAKGLLKSAIRDDNPVVFIEQKLLYRSKGPVPEQEYSIPLGSADVKREERNLSIITYGRMVQRGLEVADALAGEGIELEVVDIRSLRPLDTATLVASARKTGRVLVVHEAPQFGGFGGEIAAAVGESEAFFYLDAPIRRLGAMETPVPYNRHLEAHVVPTAERITAAVRDLLR